MEGLLDEFESGLVRRVFNWISAFFMASFGLAFAAELLYDGPPAPGHGSVLLVRACGLAFNALVLGWTLGRKWRGGVWRHLPALAVSINFAFSFLGLLVAGSDRSVGLVVFLVLSFIYLSVFGLFATRNLLTLGFGLVLAASATLLFVVYPDRFFTATEDPGQMFLNLRIALFFGILSATALVAIGNAVTGLMLRHIHESAELLRRQAYFDQATGLPNGLQLEEDIKAWEALPVANKGERVLMAGIRLEGLEALNEGRGMEFTSRVVADIARSYAEEVESRGRSFSTPGGPAPFKTLYRVEGSTFLFAWRQPRDLERLLSSQPSIAGIVSRLVVEGREPINLGFQGGFSLYPDDASSLGQLLRNVLNVLHTRRSESLGRFVGFNPVQYEEFLRKERIKDAMSSGLRGGEFWLAFQPKLDISSGRVAGFEALARWKSPTLGPVSPAEFIPLAEEHGAIEALTVTLLDQAYDFVRALRAAGRADLRVSVNLSPGLFNAAFLWRLADELGGNGLAPSLEFEITEGILMKIQAGTSSWFHELRNLGASFSIDDFGTGYSNLGYLQSLEAEVLKIDKRFIDGTPGDGKNATLVIAILQMARAFSMRVVAEGVEYGEQLEFLRSSGCDEIQGYLFSKPLPRDEALRFALGGGGGAAGSLPSP